LQDIEAVRAPQIEVNDEAGGVEPICGQNELGSPLVRLNREALQLKSESQGGQHSRIIVEQHNDAIAVCGTICRHPARQRSYFGVCRPPAVDAR
jgi:hypothetical protein